MDTVSPDIAVVQALRSDVALQLARFTQRLGVTQVVAAKRLGLPQPTLSKILNGRVSDLSLELLIRTAARAGLPMTLQTGRVPQEAGAFVSATPSRSSRTSPSKLGDQARESLNQSASRLSPTERLQAFLEHNQLMGVLHRAGRIAETQRAHKALQKP
jgi:predicted XRE-type DNA-binding protein